MYRAIDVNVTGVRTTPPRVNEQQVLRINAGQRSSSNPPPRQQLINENENNLNNNSSNSNNNSNNLNNSNLNNSNNHHDYFEIEYVQSEVRTKNKDLEVETLRSGEKKLNVKENRSAVNDGLGPGQNQGLGPGPGQGQGASQGQGQSLSPDTAKSKSSPKTIKSTSNSPISPTLLSEERPVKEEKPVKSKYSHRSLSYMMDEMSMITAMTDENILAAKNMSVSNNQKGSVEREREEKV